MRSGATSCSSGCRAATWCWWTCARRRSSRPVTSTAPVRSPSTSSSGAWPSCRPRARSSPTAAGRSAPTRTTPSGACTPPGARRGAWSRAGRNGDLRGRSREGPSHQRQEGRHHMTTQAPVDVEMLRDEIRKTYTEVSTDQEREFIFPTGRAWATALGYPEPELSRVPDASAESFAGVANHWTLGRVEPGEVVLDLGCGAGTDLLIAAQMAGPGGRAIGVDMTPAILERARAGADAMGLGNVELHESLIEALPLADESV